MDQLKEQKVSIAWPIIFITLGLFGYAVSQYMNMERSTIMNNWPQMRCNTLIMFAAYWLKPDEDPRAPGEFAAENFNFCTKGLVQNIMKVVMAPFTSIFQKQASSTNMFTGILNSIKTLIKKVYDNFLSFMDPFLRRFNAVAYQIGIVTQKLRNAFNRLNASLLTTIYSGISIIKGINNAIRFTMKVVLIICAIMLAIIFLLFLILFPFIPLIITPVLIAIIAAGAVVGGVAAAEAEDDQAGFCFTGDTSIELADGSSQSISQLVLGQELANGSVVEGILVLEGTSTPLFSLEGIRVSGSHLVKGVGGDWHSVDKDSRAQLCAERVDRLYCLNTSNQIIPVLTANGKSILFRDWEEIDSRDIIGQKGWNQQVSSLLKGLTGKEAATFCLMDPAIGIPTSTGIKPLSSIQIGDSIELSYNNHTRVIGIVEGQIEGIYSPHWMSSCIEKTFKPTVYHRITTVKQGSTELLRGKHLITDSGKLIAHVKGHVIQMRDFTEVGIDNIHQTYPFIAERLATFVPL
jgi:hypothetical protein